MPVAKELKTGDQVIGVVVSVMPFGAFVELAPDCSGLVHVSRISESYIEDLHEAIQVGDIISAWVIGIDDKRRRVSLSAVSPERAKELEAQRQSRGDRSNRGGRPQRGGDRNQPRGDRSRGDNRGKPQGKSGDSRRGSKPRQGGKTAGPRGGRDRNRGGRGRQRKPETYRVESKEEVKPITEEMQNGQRADADFW